MESFKETNLFKESCMNILEGTAFATNLGFESSDTETAKEITDFIVGEINFEEWLENTLKLEFFKFKLYLDYYVGTDFETYAMQNSEKYHEANAPKYLAERFRRILAGKSVKEAFKNLIMMQHLGMKILKEPKEYNRACWLLIFPLYEAITNKSLMNQFLDTTEADWSDLKMEELENLKISENGKNTTD